MTRKKKVVSKAGSNYNFHIKHYLQVFWQIKGPMLAKCGIQSLRQNMQLAQCHLLIQGQN